MAPQHLHLAVRHAGGGVVGRAGGGTAQHRLYAYRRLPSCSSSPGRRPNIRSRSSRRSPVSALLQSAQGPGAVALIDDGARIAMPAQEVEDQRINRPVRPLPSRKRVNLFAAAVDRGEILAKDRVVRVEGVDAVCSARHLRLGRRAMRTGGMPPGRIGCRGPEGCRERRAVSRWDEARHSRRVPCRPVRSLDHCVPQFDKILPYASPSYSELGILDNLTRPGWSHVLERLYRD